MSAMITAARKELHLSPTGASSPPPPRDPSLLRLPPGAPNPAARGRGLLLPSSAATAAGAGAAIPRLGMGVGLQASDADAGAGALAAAAAAWEEDEDEGEEGGERRSWPGAYPEDEEEALEAAGDLVPARRAGRRPLRKIRRVARFGVGQEAAVDGLGAGGGRHAELFGVDPAASRPAYEILDVRPCSCACLRLVFGCVCWLLLCAAAPTARPRHSHPLTHSNPTMIGVQARARRGSLFGAGGAGAGAAGHAGALARVRP